MRQMAELTSKERGFHDALKVRVRCLGKITKSISHRIHGTGIFTYMKGCFVRYLCKRFISGFS